MELESALNPDTLKAGDIISKWERWSSRSTLGNSSPHFEAQRHIIIEVTESAVYTVLIFSSSKCYSNRGYNPGCKYTIERWYFKGGAKWTIAE
jgi:hypothetical protein